MPYDLTSFSVDKNLDLKLNFSNAYFERKDNVIELFSRLFSLNKDIFKDKKICITSGDYPEAESCYNDFDYKFSTTIDINNPFKYSFFPCPYSISWKQVNINDAEQLIKDLLQNNLQPSNNKIFWAGGPQHQQRFDYVEYSKINTDICETRVTDNTIESRNKNFISLMDHCNYKFLMDIQGQGYSARVKYLLATGRPIFLVPRQWTEHWHRLLIPWKHFIPVKEDFSDLREHFTKVNNDVALYDYISSSSKQFVKDNIILDVQLPFILNTLK
jgi:hypothetical protein